MKRAIQGHEICFSVGAVQFEPVRSRAQPLEEVAEFRGRHDAVPSRRVVLVPQSPQGTPESYGDRFSQEGSGGLVLSQAVVSAHNAEHSVHEDEVGLPSSDTETVGPVSEVSLQAPSAVSEVVPVVEEFNVSPAIRDALIGLDTLDVGNIFRRRPSVMRSPPMFLCGAFRSALRVALLAIVKGAERRDEGIQCRGWKLFLLLPRRAVATSRSSDLSNVLHRSHVANGNSC